MATVTQFFAEASRNFQQGRPDAAEQLCLQILATNSEHVDALHMLGIISSQQRRYELAEAYLKRAISLRGNDAALHGNLGLLFQSQGRLNDAINAFTRALQFKPDYALAHYNVAAAYQAQGKLDLAVASYRRAIELKPDLCAAHLNLGNIHQSQGRAAEAAESFCRALALKPDLFETHNNLGNMLLALGKTEEAIASYRQALQLKPDLYVALTNLGAALQRQGKIPEAIDCYERGLKVNPDDPVAHHNLATAYQAQWEPEKSAAACLKALEQDPQFADAYSSLGTSAYEQGKADEAVVHYRRALELNPNDAQTHSNLLRALQYQTSVTLAGLAAAHAEFETQHASQLLNNTRPHTNSRREDRVLRLGFVSPDFGRHPVGYFIIRALENLDHSQLETICYSVRTNVDDLTKRFQAASTHWHEAAELSDQELADKIRSEEVDILFDLAGYTGKNRILVFARKPAPIQIAWAGHASTTGLAAMDYILADRYHIPLDAEPHYRERVLRMPDDYVCYDPPADTPSVSALPALSRRSISFGSFNNPAKINAQVIRTWANILDRVPESRLVLKYRGFHNPTVANRLAHEFADHGINPERIEFGSSPPEKLLADYNAIDLALDPFPYSGGLTTCEALWMGVPVVTWPGETFASRHSLSHLSNVGLTETIARDLNDYVDLAVSLASDPTRLAQIRAGLREQMAASPLCDGKRFADNFERVLRDVWRQWCRGNSPQ